MNEPDPVADAERIAGHSAEGLPETDGEAFVENADSLPRQDGFGAEETSAPDGTQPGATPVDPLADDAKPRARRRRRPTATWTQAEKTTGRDLVASVLLSVETAEAYRRRTGHYGRGADYLRLVTAGEARQRLAAGINLAVDLGLIRLELRPVWPKIRRFSDIKCPLSHGKITTNEEV